MENQKQSVSAQNSDSWSTSGNLSSPLRSPNRPLLSTNPKLLSVSPSSAETRFPRLQIKPRSVPPPTHKLDRRLLWGIRTFLRAGNLRWCRTSLSRWVSLRILHGWRRRRRCLSSSLCIMRRGGICFRWLSLGKGLRVLVWKKFRRRWSCYLIWAIRTSSAILKCWRSANSSLRMPWQFYFLKGIDYLFIC